MWVYSQTECSPTLSAGGPRPWGKGRGAQDTGQSPQDACGIKLQAWGLFAQCPVPRSPAPPPPSNLGQRPPEVPEDHSSLALNSHGFSRLALGVGRGETQDSWKAGVGGPPEFYFLMFLPNTFC